MASMKNVRSALENLRKRKGFGPSSAANDNGDDGATTVEKADDVSLTIGIAVPKTEDEDDTE